MYAFRFDFVPSPLTFRLLLSVLRFFLVYVSENKQCSASFFFLLFFASGSFFLSFFEFMIITRTHVEYK